MLPTLAVVAGLIGGAVLSAIPVRQDTVLMRLSFQGTADDARQILIVVSATMITVTGIVFSLTVVSLQIASSQFSVRLLRTFMRDVPNQVVLAVFISTFAYSTGGLYTVGRRAGGTAFVPRVAVSGSIWLAFLSTGALVYFLHRLVHSIQVDTIMEGVQRRTLALVDDLFPETGDRSTGAAESQPPPPPPGAMVLAAPCPGYVQMVDVDALAALADRHRMTVRVAVSVGDHVTGGGMLGWCWPRPVPAAGGVGSADSLPALDRRVVDRVVRAIGIGFERTLQQDVRFGLRQLVDIALRALSPAINDPYTAVQTVHHLSAIESVLAGRLIRDDVRRHADGAVLVWLPYPGFATYLELGCAQIRRCGQHEPLVLAALLQLLSDVAARCAAAAGRAAVLAQIDLIADAAQRAIPTAADRTMVAGAVALAREVALHPGMPAPVPAAFGMVAAAASHVDTAPEPTP